MKIKLKILNANSKVYSFDINKEKDLNLNLFEILSF